MKKTLIVLSLLSFAVCSQGALIVNGDMSAPIAGTGNNLVGGNENNGWYTKNTSAWKINAGSMTLNANTTQSTSSTNAIKFSVAQANAVTTETGTSWTLKFDWTASTLASGAALDVSYNVVGWKGTTTTPVGTERYFTGLNFRSAQSRDVGSSTDKVDLLTGTSKGTGNDNMTTGSFSGIAGTTQSAAVNLNLGGTDMSAFDYIGVKFYIGTSNEGDGVLVDGSTLDNVALIPEPATIGLIGAFGFGLLFIRRRFTI